MFKDYQIGDTVTYTHKVMDWGPFWRETRCTGTLVRVNKSTVTLAYKSGETFRVNRNRVVEKEKVDLCVQ